MLERILKQVFNHLPQPRGISLNDNMGLSMHINGSSGGTQEHGGSLYQRREVAHFWLNREEPMFESSCVKQIHD
jgi:hypothetical protein